LVLLMLYLEMDENDRRPLLVDQPEENLDNESIYETLRGYFRRAKRRRQIVLVTHNPNLVVNTDADQVIVACATESEANEFPSLSYVSGSLENSDNDPGQLGIRQKVCRILEGGDVAFRSRERRYATRLR
jgi:predicted ATP-dependent endonuclease of OLD family